jgi:hypothetical protein
MHEDAAFLPQPGPMQASRAENGADTGSLKVAAVVTVNDEPTATTEMQLDANASSGRIGSEPLADEIIVSTECVAPLQDATLPVVKQSRDESQSKSAVGTDSQPAAEETLPQKPGEPVFSEARLVLDDSDTKQMPCRRNPKRSAAVSVEPKPADAPRLEDILDATLEPMTEEELEEWEGWVELESEPVRLRSSACGGDPSKVPVVPSPRLLTLDL